ncbi:hypothetical protein DFH11DRAFT_1546299 [Phellopilus nigrolimitatus]|nr:hypothetical protein DFH11DRAFT_1546299 [Phellopilus nigrolimitatus]
MTTNRKDEHDDNKQPVRSASPQHNETADIAELFGAVRGLGTVMEGNGRPLPDLGTYVLSTSAAPGVVLSNPGPNVAAAPAPVQTAAVAPLAATKAENGSPGMSPCAGPSWLGSVSTQRRSRWLEAGRYVSGVTGAIFRGYDSEEEATDAYNEAVRAGHVRIVPDINNVLNRCGIQIVHALTVHFGAFAIQSNAVMCAVVLECLAVEVCENSAGRGTAAATMQNLLDQRTSASTASGKHRSRGYAFIVTNETSGKRRSREYAFIVTKISVLMDFCFDSMGKVPKQKHGESAEAKGMLSSLQKNKACEAPTHVKHFVPDGADEMLVRLLVRLTRGVARSAQSSLSPFYDTLHVLRN